MDNVLDLSRAANIITTHKPDLCGLQEVDNYCQRSNNIGQTEYLAQQTATTGHFGRFMHFQKGEYGMATLTALPLHASSQLPLPKGIYEPRCALLHQIQMDSDKYIVFANVHLDWVENKAGATSRLAQAKALLQHIDSLGHACIITGDFNCTPQSPCMQYFYQQGFVFAPKGADSLSFQGSGKAEIDHLIYRNSPSVKFKVVSTRLLAAPLCSDHRPLLSEIEVHF